jgi:hypothetical protein
MMGSTRSRLLAAVFAVGLGAYGARAFATESSADPTYDITFKLPSSVTLSGSSSSSNTKSGALGVHLMLPRNFWIDGAVDQATEDTDGLLTKTLGGSVSLGTDPLAEYALDVGVDTSGVEDQYRVTEGRARITAMPDSYFGLSNSGLELVLELRSARFAFANNPNIIFNTNGVELNAGTLRFEANWYGWSPWSLRLWTEQTSLDDKFKDLNRPLAPLFIPVTAISTGLSWPGDEYGIGFGYSRRRWGLRLALSKKRAAITEDKTTTAALAADLRWTPRVSTSLRFAQIQGVTEGTSGSDGEPIQTGGVDLTFSF